MEMGEHKSLDCFIEFTVPVVNINKGCNEDIVGRSENLSGYVELITEVNKNIDSNMGKDVAVEAAVKSCISKGILAEFLKNNSSEVINMLTNEYNIEDEITVVREEAEALGVQKGFFEGVKKLLQKKSPAEVADLYDLPLSKVEELANA